MSETEPAPLRGRTRAHGIAQVLPTRAEAIEASKAADETTVRKNGSVTFRCALCPEWSADDLRDQTRHIRDVHGIEARPRPRGIARGPKRSPNKNAKPITVALDGSCLTCGQTHTKTGGGFADHEAWLAGQVELVPTG